jgi:hypothetical protein
VSPELTVGNQPLSITFRHRFAFESDENNRYDGGVVEISANNGATWTDIGVGYNGTIATGSGNPLEGRMAYTAMSLSYPNFQTQTINLGTTYRNRKVRLRLRIGTDALVGDAGWDVDDISFVGLTNTPFPAIGADTGCR